MAEAFARSLALHMKARRHVGSMRACRKPEQVRLNEHLSLFHEHPGIVGAVRLPGALDLDHRLARLPEPTAA